MARIDVNLDGQRFGRWTVIETIPNYKNNKTYCMCLCDCGTKKYIARHSLLSGGSQSCGCLSREQTSTRCRKDYVGQVFGELTVSEMLYGYKNGKTYCRCLCSCGNEHIASISNLVCGSVKSCGCRSGELMWNTRGRTNLVGLIFGKLTVMEMLYGYGNSQRTHCRCICECGNESIADMQNLLSGSTSSCGCGASWCRHGDVTHKDLCGVKFGMLTVINKTDDKYMNGCIIWECLCDCGNIVYAPTDALTSYKKTSCGCSNYSNMEQFIADCLNKYDILYVPQARFSDCRNKYPLPFDFYLPEYNTCIEFDGEQHFKPIQFFGGKEEFQYRQQNDTIKTSYCVEHNINLVRLPYTLTTQEIEDNLIHIWNPQRLCGIYGNSIPTPTPLV